VKIKYNPEDELKNLEILASLGDTEALIQLQNLREQRGLCRPHGLGARECPACNNLTKLVWDDAQNFLDNITRIMQMAREEGNPITYNAAEELARQDHDYSDDIQEQLYEDLSEMMKEINPENDEWLVHGEDLGWRRQVGSKIIKATTGKELLNKILPPTDCTYTIYKWPAERKLKIVNSHHDAMGEVYWIYPTNEFQQCSNCDELFEPKELLNGLCASCSKDADDRRQSAGLRNNPDDLENLRLELQLTPSSGLRFQYLQLQHQRGYPRDISILTEDDIHHPQLINILDSPTIDNLSFGSESLRILFSRLKLVIINYFSIQARGETERAPRYAITSIETLRDIFKIIKFAWFPATQYKKPFFRLLVQIPEEHPPWTTQDALIFHMEIPYSLSETNKCILPLEKCYLCNTNCLFYSLDSFSIPLGISNIEIQGRRTPDYLSPLGNYGEPNYSEASGHYRITDHPVIWYALYSELGIAKSAIVAVYLHSPANLPINEEDYHHMNATQIAQHFRVTPIEGADKILPRKVIRSLQKGDSYILQMPDVSDLEIQGMYGPQTFKVSGFRDVHVNCQKTVHRFPYFLWRLPGEVHSYHLSSKDLENIDVRFVKDNLDLGIELPTN